MTHVVQHPSPPFPIAGGDLMVHQIPLGHDNLGWLLVSPRTGGCAIVDGPDAQPYLDRVAAEGWQLKAVFNTHIHSDHIGVNHALGDQLQGLRVYGATKTRDDIPGLTDPLEDGDSVTFEGANIDVWLTEGHINGHLSFVTDGAVFCGDTLFTGGCGYLFDGPPATMHQSLQRLAQLPDTTLVCCAHEYTMDNLRFAWTVEPGNPDLADRIRAVWQLRAAGGCAVPSTMAQERLTNPFLRVNATEIRSRLGFLSDSQTSNDGAKVFRMIRQQKDSGRHKTLADSALPLLGGGRKC